MARRADSVPWSLETASTVPLWIDRLDPPVAHRRGLDGDLDVDVAIVGGGFSGLWTAYYLKHLAPALRVAVLERHHCGFGASGRNGGWAVGELAGSVADYARRSGTSESLRLLRAVFDAVDEIGRVAAEEQIDCDYAKGGTIRVARTAPQAERQAAEIVEARSLGLTEDEIRLLGPDEAREQINAAEVRSGILLCSALPPWWTPPSWHSGWPVLSRRRGWRSTSRPVRSASATARCRSLLRVRAALR